MIEYSGKPAIIFAAIDITERKLAEEEISYLTRIYALISQVNQTIVRIRDVDELLEELCRVAIVFGKFKFAAICLFANATSRIDKVYKYGYDNGFSDLIPSFSTENNEPFLPFLYHIRIGNPYINNDIVNSIDVNDFITESKKAFFKSIAAFPIKEGDKNIGMFLFFASEPNIL